MSGRTRNYTTSMSGELQGSPRNRAMLSVARELVAYRRAMDTQRPTVRAAGGGQGVTRRMGTFLIGYDNPWTELLKPNDNVPLSAQ